MDSKGSDDEERKILGIPVCLFVLMLIGLVILFFLIRKIGKTSQGASASFPEAPGYGSIASSDILGMSQP